MFERIKRRVLLKESFSNPHVHELIREDYSESDGSSNLDSQLCSWFEVWASG
jgi:hypothetical protein